MNFKIFVATLALSGSLFAAQTVELSGDKNYPPYSYSENGIAKGVYVDILKSAFSKMPKYDLKLNMMAYKRAIKMTQDGKTVGFFHHIMELKGQLGQSFQNQFWVRQL